MKKFVGSNPGHGKTTTIIKNNKTVVLTTNAHLKTGVDSTPETLCENTLDNGFTPTNRKNMFLMKQTLILEKDFIFFKLVKIINSPKSFRNQ